MIKNFSLMAHEGKVHLTPAYDILNTTLVLSDPAEEIALPVKGRKRKLDSDILIDYFGQERLGLNRKTIASIIAELVNALPVWQRLIDICFLPREFKTEFSRLVHSRQHIVTSYPNPGIFSGGF
jgi:serine/threonine-protein kinase HipA